MKTKITVIVGMLWLILSGLHELGLIDALPIENENLRDWIKWGISVLLLIAGTFFVKPEIAKRMITGGSVPRNTKDSIGGGGIQNPPPKPKNKP